MLPISYKNAMKILNHKNAEFLITQLVETFCSVWALCLRNIFTCLKPTMFLADLSGLLSLRCVGKRNSFNSATQ